MAKKGTGSKKNGLKLLKQPNHITTIHGDFKLLQLRILVAVTDTLQSSIDEVLGGMDLNQLELFKDHNRHVSFKVPLKEFGVTPANYPKLKEALKGLATIPVEFDIKDPDTGAPAWQVQGLFSSVIIPKDSHSRAITIEMSKDVVKTFAGVSAGYTKFYKEIAMNSRSKYTLRLYMLISRWKDRGGFSIYMEKFRKVMWLEDKYPEYKHVYQRVLKPAHDELHENADCWFEVAPAYNKGETQPYKLDFKIIRGEMSAAELEKVKKCQQQVKALTFNHGGSSIRPDTIEKVLEFVSIYNHTYATNAAVEVLLYMKDPQHVINDYDRYFYVAMKNKLNPDPLFSIIGDDIADDPADEMPL